MLLIFNRSPFTSKSPLLLARSRLILPPPSPPCFHPRVWVGPHGRRHHPLPRRLRDGPSPGGWHLPPRSGKLREPQKRRRSGEKGLAFHKPSLELPNRRLNYSPPANPLLYPKKNSGYGARGSAGRRVPLPRAPPHPRGRPPGAAGAGGDREAIGDAGPPPPRQLRD